MTKHIAEDGSHREFTDEERVDIVERACAVIDKLNPDDHAGLVVELTVLARDLATYQVLLGRILPRMKRKILEDMRSGKVPRTVRTFSALHDHVDANEYGGFTDATALANSLDVGDESDCEFVNVCQEEIDQWLASGAAEKESR